MLTKSPHAYFGALYGRTAASLCASYAGPMGWRGEKSVSVVRISLKKGIGTMEVQLTDDQKAFVRQAIDSGRYSREEDALREALSLWESRERRRAEILAAVDQAEA